MNDLADLTMFIINEFGEYIEGSDNPIDTTMKIMKGLKAENELLKQKIVEADLKALR